jgi:hypothetical protein
MKLHELAFVIGDDGGMQGQVDKALKNMEHHAKHGKDKETRAVCANAVSAVKRHVQNPASMYDDPHTFLSMMSTLNGTPDCARIRSVIDSMASFTQVDNE